MDISEFFRHIRVELFGGSITQSQVDGTNALLDAWKSFDPRWTAYALATAFHETDFTMQPIAECGHGKGQPYGAAVGPYGQRYYGRGYVQLTWAHNFDRADKEIPGFDLLREPDNALKPEVAAVIMVRGMTEGWFTGLKLDHYFNAKITDWVNARRIINGLDCAARIASYAVKFNNALKGTP